jgi:hypothetical protein
MTYYINILTFIGFSALTQVNGPAQQTNAEVAPNNGAIRSAIQIIDRESKRSIRRSRNLLGSSTAPECFGDNPLDVRFWHLADIRGTATIWSLLR